MTDEYEVRIRFLNVEPGLAANLQRGAPVSCWSKDGYSLLHFYAPGYIGGQGLISRMPKDQVPALGSNYHRVTANIDAIEGTTVYVMCRFSADDALPF